jgi:translation elongation factor EF-G
VFRVTGEAVPQRFRERGYDELQITLVDCPGHASFIRTIIGGAQIIDYMLLVIDSVKGVQTQTVRLGFFFLVFASPMSICLL